MDRENLRSQRIDRCLDNVRSEDVEAGKPDAVHPCPGCHYVIGRTPDDVVKANCKGFEPSSSNSAPVRASRSIDCILHQYDYSQDPNA